MSDEETAIVGVRVADNTGPVIWETIVRPCADCQEPMYVAPSSFEILAAGAILICVPCIRRRIAEQPDLIESIAPVREEQIEEIRTLLEDQQNG